MANAFNVDVYANLAVCTCRAHCCPSTGVYRGRAKVSSVGSFYNTRLTALVHGSGLTASRVQLSLLPLTFDPNLTLFPSWWLMEF